MFIHERTYACEFSTAEIVAHTAESAVIYVTQRWLAWQNRILLDAVHPDDITMKQFRKAAVQATQSDRAYMSALTGNFLRTSFPEQLTDMFLLRSKIPTDTPTGRKEATKWKFDT